MADNEKDRDESLKPEETVEETGAEEIAIEDGDLEAATPEEAPDSDGAGEDEEKAPKKKGFFRKDKKDKKDEKIEELTDKVMRQMAEFDNYRKRTEKEKQQMYAVGASDVIEKLLPVIDNFERGLAAMGDDEKESSFAQGIVMIYKQMMTVLEGLGDVSDTFLNQPNKKGFKSVTLYNPEASTVERLLKKKGYWEGGSTSSIFTPTLGERSKSIGSGTLSAVNNPSFENTIHGLDMWRKNKMSVIGGGGMLPLFAPGRTEGTDSASEEPSSWDKFKRGPGARSVLEGWAMFRTRF